MRHAGRDLDHQAERRRQAKSTLDLREAARCLGLEPDHNSQLRLRTERQIGQLNFKDFAASSALEAGTVNAGNPNLDARPRLGLSRSRYERRFWGGGGRGDQRRARRHEGRGRPGARQRVDAPGNIGDGTKDELKLSLTLPLDKLGIKNGQFRFNGTWRWSQGDRPGHRHRAAHLVQPAVRGRLLLSASNCPTWKSSINLDGNLGCNETSYRIGEIRRLQETPFVKLYWDWARDLT